MKRIQFPDQFLWGVATSAQQIEGARRHNGRGESIWDRFAEQKGAIADGSDADTACDHFHRWRDDVELMNWLGVGAYRFSISWPRIMPYGTGKPATLGLDFYDALVDRLLETGIRPCPTLYHWDLPQVLQDSGGWESRKTAEAFVDYAEAVVLRLGDRVTDWTTHNEPWCAAVLGHEEGCHAPGRKDPLAGMTAAHHMLLSHGLAAKAIRSLSSKARVGIVQLYCPAYPATDSEADHDAARWFDGFFNRWFLDPVFLGSYPVDAIADRIAAGQLAGPKLPFVEPGDLKTISTPLDFVGLNYYSRSVMRTDENGRRIPVPQGTPEERTDMDWEVYPEGLYDSLTRVSHRYSPKEIFLTEFGAAVPDQVIEPGHIVDERRSRFLHDHLLAAHRAINEGVPLSGCFVWSLMDNWEWSWGFEKRFGLISIDPKTLERVPRDSAFWYRDVVEHQAINKDFILPTRGDARVQES